jgi:hypothetical protein
MNETIKNILNGIAILVLVLLVLSAFGALDSVAGLPVGG